jgi:hypothetical protein
VFFAIVPPSSFIAYAYSNGGHFLGSPASLVAIGETTLAAYVSVGLTVNIRKNGSLFPPLGVCETFDNLPNGHVVWGVYVSTEGMKVLMGASGYIRFLFVRRV